MDLEELRAKIDAVDDRLTAAYLERLELVTQVAEYKRAHAVEVEHTGREEAIFRRLAQKNRAKRYADRGKIPGCGDSPSSLQTSAV